MAYRRASLIISSLIVKRLCSFPIYIHQNYYTTSSTSSSSKLSNQVVSNSNKVYNYSSSFNVNTSLIRGGLGCMSTNVVGSNISTTDVPPNVVSATTTTTCNVVSKAPQTALLPAAAYSASDHTTFRYGVTPRFRWKGVLVQGLVFAGFLTGIVHLVDNIPSFKQGRALWFTHLTTDDILYSPVLRATSFWTTMQCNMQDCLACSPASGAMEIVSRVLSVPTISSLHEAPFCNLMSSNMLLLVDAPASKASGMKNFLGAPIALVSPSTLPHQPAPSTTPQQPAPSSQPQQPALSTTLQQPAPSIKLQQPAPSTTLQQPAPSTMLQQPAPSIMLQQPAPSTPPQQPAPSTMLQQPAPSITLQQPAPSTPSQQPAPSTSSQQPDPSKADSLPKHPWKGSKLEETVISIGIVIYLYLVLNSP